MSVEKPPAFQFYPKDFLTAESVRLMSLKERGVYITLLCHNWLEQSLPNHVPTLAKLVDLRTKVFATMWNSVLARCFFTGSDGRLRNPRLEREREKQAEFRAIKAAAGRLGGRPKKAQGFFSESKPKAKKSPPVFDLQTPVRTPQPPLKGGRSRRRRRQDIPGGGSCSHSPRCHTTKACIERTLADARRKRAAS